MPPPAPLPRLRVEDATLVRRSRGGDDRAFEELVRRHADLAYRVALRMMRDPHEAENVAQQAFIRAWERLDTFRGDAAFSTWLYRIVTTTCLDELRARRITAPLQDHRADDGPSAHDLVVGADTAAVVHAAMADLLSGDRAAFVLRTFEDLSYDEIAAALGVSTSAVRSRLRRARLVVAHHLDADPREADDA